MTIEEYKNLLRGKLTEKRYRHSLGVAEEAVRLAKRYGADPDKAYLAGLLHDIMKDTDKAETLQMLESFDIMLTDVERHAQKLWHAIAGAAFAERCLHLADREICTAIRYHTTARKDMSLLEKVLYLADFTSADRDYDGVEEMRKAVDDGLETAMLAALKFTIGDLLSDNYAIHPDTLDAYNQVVLSLPDRQN